MAEHNRNKHANNFKDLTGQRFGKLIVLSIVPERKHRSACWKCLCECGATTVVMGTDLRNPKGTRSCGCYRIERVREVCTIHGKTKTREFRAWTDAKTRCFNPKNSHFASYGGRGITMCDEWRNSFERFLSDMGVCPPGLTLERRDVNGNYTPDNCEWATLLQQARNKRNSKCRA